MSEWSENLLKSYKDGLGYREGDVLKLKPGATWHWSGSIVGENVAVLRQNALMPWTYEVIAERKGWKSPADKFFKAEINGHDWEIV